MHPAPLSGAPALAFLRQIAEGTDPLILPNVAAHPALAEIAPGGLPLIQGFAATHLSSRGHVTGTLCVMDTKILQMGAAELDAIDALGRDLARDLAAHDSAIPESVARAAAVSPTSELDSLERLASADPLTGLANRRGGERDISAEISRARRQTTPLSCLLLDIDHFKLVNDTSSHPRETTFCARSASCFAGRCGPTTSWCAGWRRIPHRSTRASRRNRRASSPSGCASRWSRCLSPASTASRARFCVYCTREGLLVRRDVCGSRSPALCSQRAGRNRVA